MKVSSLRIKKEDIPENGAAKAVSTWMKDRLIRQQQDAIAKGITEQLSTRYNNVLVDFPEKAEPFLVRIRIDGILLPGFNIAPETFMTPDGEARIEAFVRICVESSLRMMMEVPFKDYKELRQYLEPRMIAHTVNESFMNEADVVYRRYGDFMMICEISYQKEGIRLLTPVTVQLLKDWGITQETFFADLLTEARKRKPCLYPFTQETQHRIGRSLGGDNIDLPENLFDGEPQSTEEAYAFTFEGSEGGMLLFAMPDIMQKIAAYVGRDYYISPVTDKIVVITPVDEHDIGQLESLLYAAVRTPSVPGSHVPSVLVQYYSVKEGTYTNAAGRRLRGET